MYWRQIMLMDKWSIIMKSAKWLAQGVTSSCRFSLASHIYITAKEKAFDKESKCYYKKYRGIIFQYDDKVPSYVWYTWKTFIQKSISFSCFYRSSRSAETEQTNISIGDSRLPGMTIFSQSFAAALWMKYRFDALKLLEHFTDLWRLLGLRQHIWNQKVNFVACQIRGKIYFNRIDYLSSCANKTEKGAILITR